MGTLAVAPGSVLLGKYRIESVLGEGGMGVVFRARHLELDEVVAVKVLSQDAAVSAETFARFQREAKAAARLKSQHVVRVTDVGKLPDGLPYMVMELLDGNDLSQEVRRGGPLPVSKAADLIIQVCEALTEAHSLGIVHRDLKPSNLFVTKRDDGTPCVKVLDFGIAKVESPVDFSLTRTSSVLGTPGYMSPEQLRSSRTVDHRTDIWALGVVLFQLFEGQRPFDAEVFSELCMKIGVDRPPPMKRVPPEVEAIVLRCLEKRPEDRYASVADLAIALGPFAADRRAADREIERMQRILRAGAVRKTPNPVATPADVPRGRLDAVTAGADLAPIPADPDEVTTPANARRSAIAATSTSSPAERAMAFQAAPGEPPAMTPDGPSIGAADRARAFPAYATAHHIDAPPSTVTSVRSGRWRWVLAAFAVVAVSVGAAAAVMTQREEAIADAPPPVENKVVMPAITIDAAAVPEVAVDAAPAQPVVVGDDTIGKLSSDSGRGAAVEVVETKPPTPRIRKPSDQVVHKVDSKQVDTVDTRTVKPPQTGSGASPVPGAGSGVPCAYTNRHGC